LSLILLWWLTLRCSKQFHENAKKRSWANRHS